MLLFFKFIILLLAVVMGYSLGYYFTEVNIISQRWPLFDFRGFSCRRCLSTHIAWVTSTAASLLLNDWIMLGICLIFAAALFVGLTLDEKSKTVSINDYDKIVRNEI